ncbi:hypothetical protein [Ruegeria sp. HU-ET01832]|uniref:hypothetical protein n=1 Tax=Ruegeria sp. HU-ET01832 TaxID=3135906 RepID=UPI0033401871
MRAIIAAVLFAVILAVFMTTTICGWDGLMPENFRVIRSCGTTDSPNEVFLSFLVFGCFLGVILSILLLLERWVFKRYLP